MMRNPALLKAYRTSLSLPGTAARLARLASGHRLYTSTARRGQSSTYTSATSTVNEEEIAHFSRLSSLWWDEHGEFAFLHKMNPVRVQYICDKFIEITREERGETWAD